MILGWIGCSPIPMARQEMEQALLVDSRCGAPSVIGQLNFVRICGSVIELADDMLQFVHFTVKEYVRRDTLVWRGFKALTALQVHLQPASQRFRWQGRG